MDQIYVAHNLFRNSELIQDQHQDLITEMINKIRSSITLKKDSSPLYQNARQSKTDKKLSAELFIQSMNYDQTPIILTNDTDFYPLIGISMRLLGSPTFLPYNKGFRGAMFKNPPLIGMPYENMFRITILETDGIEEPFRIKSIPSFQSEQIKERISDLWIQFYKIEQNSNLPYHNHSLFHQ